MLGGVEKRSLPDGDTRGLAGAGSNAYQGRLDRRAAAAVMVRSADHSIADHAARVLQDQGFRVQREPEAGTLEVGSLQIDCLRHRVSYRGRPVLLTATEFRLLVALAERPDVVQRPDALLTRAWGPEFREDAGYLKPVVSRLRRKLGDNARTARLIETVRGFGYRLRSDEPFTGTCCRPGSPVRSGHSCRPESELRR